MNNVGCLVTVALIIGFLVGWLTAFIIKVPQQQTVTQKPSARVVYDRLDKNSSWAKEPSNIEVTPPPPVKPKK